MMQMDSFNFGNWFGFCCSFPFRNNPKIHYFNKIPHLVLVVGRLLESMGVSCVIHLIGHIFMMQMDSFNFGFWLWLWSTSLFRISPKIHLFYYYSAFCPSGGRLLESIRFSGIFHLIGHIFMMQIDSFNNGYWFGFWSSFPFRITPKIHVY